MTWRERLTEFTKRHEGYRDKPYADTVGKLTGGWGHNLTDNGLPMHVWQIVYDIDEAEALRAAEALPYWTDLPDNWRMIVPAMIFQLGAGGFAGFHKLNAALADGDYERARHQMLASNWAAQTPKRAQELYDLAGGAGV